MRRETTFWIIVVVATFILYASVIAPAFWSFVIVGPSGRFDYHSEITNDAIGSAFVDEETLKRLFHANGESDMGANLNNHALHFDSEAFQQGTQLLASNLNEAAASLAACEKDQAIRHLGAAFHAVQDFYAHSNWVENHLTNPTMVPTQIPFCPSLVTLGADGIFVAGPLAADPNFQDTCTQAPGPANPSGPVASGYYPEGPGQVPTKKCSHHATNKDSAAFNNPAVPDQYESPRGAYTHNQLPLHLFAKYAAQTHTRELWDGPATGQGFKQALRLRYGEQQGDEYYNLLVRKQRNIAFVIDTSGSMGGEIGPIRDKIVGWVNSLSASEVAPRLTLVTFDNFVYSPRTTCSRAEFLSWVQSLGAGGGSGCGESSITAALTAADVVGKDGILVLATDEPPNEGPELKEVLKQKPVKIYTIWERFDCSPQVAVGGEEGATAGVPPLASETFAEIAAATGGLSFPSLSDVDLALDVVLEATTPRLYDIALVEGAVASGETDVVTVPIESSIERVDLITTSAEQATHVTEVRRPNGAVVTSNDSDATILSGATFTRVSIIAPASGEWTIRVTGSGNYQASAVGVSDLALFDVDFLRVRSSGDTQPTVSEIDGGLNVAETVNLEASMLGNFSAAALELTLPDGSLLATLPTTEDLFDLGILSADYAPPAPIDRFLVRVRGNNGSGQAFQRILRRSFRVSSLAITAPVGKLTSPDCEISYAFELQNHGAADTFAVSAASESGFSTTVGNASLSLPTGASATVQVAVSIPPGTDRDSDALFLVATALGDPNVTNVAGVTTLIEANADCNCNGVRDGADIAAGTSTDCNENTVPDECDAPAGCDLGTLAAPDAAANDFFGLAASMNGDLVIIGAPAKHCAAGTDCGAAYLFRLTSSAWSYEAKLTPPSQIPDNWFGQSVDAYGQTVIVGGANSAHVFGGETGVWTLEADLTGSDTVAGDDFGEAVAVYGNIAVVGAPYDDNERGEDAGAVYVFRREGSTWVEDAKLVISNGWPGASVGFSVALDNDLLLIGGRYHYSWGTTRPAAYMFQRVGTSWTLESSLYAFGITMQGVFPYTVALDADVAVIGAFAAQQPVGDELVGAVYPFRRVNGVWVSEGILTHADGGSPLDTFGYAVSVLGDRLAVGAFNRGCCGVVYRYKYTTDTWAPDATLLVPTPEEGAGFGSAIAQVGNRLLVGSHSKSCAAGLDCGAAYVFAQDFFFQNDDCDCDGTPDGCELARGDVTDCNHDAVPDECGEPVPPALQHDPNTIKNRALSFTVLPPAAGGPVSTALRVRAIDLYHPVPANAPGRPQPNFSAFDIAPNNVCTGPGPLTGYYCQDDSDCNGSGTCPPLLGCSAAGEGNACARWVGPPFTYLESRDSPGLGSYKAARLQCSPHYRDWSADGVLQIVGAEIIPSSTYEVEVVHATCAGQESTCPNVSCPITIVTSRGGDVFAPFNPPSTSPQPEGPDVAAVVNKYKNLPGAIAKSIAQVNSNAPILNNDVDGSDISVVVDAVKGFAYGFSGPCPCPSSVPCDTTVCLGNGQCVGAPGNYGAGAQCVRECQSGPRAGQPCTESVGLPPAPDLDCGSCNSNAPIPGLPCDANSDCTPGTCATGVCGAGTNYPVSGFCRDRCGRCN